MTLALGAAKLAKEGAIVARMSAVEEMAGMSVLCSDKTGAPQYIIDNLGNSIKIGKFGAPESVAVVCGAAVLHLVVSWVSSFPVWIGV